MTNERQKVQITVTKTDSETKEALEGAVFGLFAKEDIVNKDGKVIVKADTQIERTVTGKDGKAAFTSDLPLGQYYVKEIEAPKGYVKSDKIFDVDASYQGDKVKVIEFDAAFEKARKSCLEQSFLLLMLMESLLRAGYLKQERLI